MKKIVIFVARLLLFLAVVVMCLKLLGYDVFEKLGIYSPLSAIARQSDRH